MKFWVLIGSLFFLITYASPEEPTVLEPSQKIAEALKPYVSVSGPSVLLENSLVFVGDGKSPLANYSILISGERISAIGPTGSITAPKETHIIDLKGYSIMPGIVGLHRACSESTSC